MWKHSGAKVPWRTNTFKWILEVDLMFIWDVIQLLHYNLTSKTDYGIDLGPIGSPYYFNKYIDLKFLFFFLVLQISYSVMVHKALDDCLN